MRIAIYFTPPAEDPLTQAASLWLGRSAFDGGPTRTPDPALDPLVTDPVRYGFHATLVAPFRLAASATIAGLEEALAGLAAHTAPADLGRLRVGNLSGFLALLPECAAGAAEIEERLRVAATPFRAPLTSDEIARRNPDSLTSRQRDNLHRWGYPYVGPDYRFHMTLTCRLEDPAGPEAELTRRLGLLLGRPRRIDAVAIFVETAPKGPFLVHRRFPLTGS